MKHFALRHRRVTGAAGAVVAFSIGLVYLYVVPGNLTGQTDLAELILRYAHSLCWVVLSGLSLAFAFGASKLLMTSLAYAALVTYVVFIVVLFGTQ